ncbi:MAG: FAD-dependent urate hydroxylase, partial [Micromonosporaceae bacterium]|nr:FAD-dependent urate hydroxylase [Micromonosporaceae bacterium]
RTGGAAITIFSNGAAALAGLGAPLAGLGGRIDSLQFRTADGAAMFSTDLTVMARRTGFPVATVPRDRLIAHLAGDLPDGVVSFSSGIVTATATDRAASVTDTTGAQHRARVLVGADGHRSVVRRAILDGTPATECGWTTWQGLTLAPAELADLADGAVGICVVGRSGLCGLMPAGGGLLQWWFDVPGSGPEAGTMSPADWLRSQFAGYAAPVSDLLATVRDDQLESFPHVVHRVPSGWGTGAATLLGDAAHVFPPSQAQGANQALEDAWLLSRALGKASGKDRDDIVPRLRRYEALRAPRVRRVSTMAARETTNKPPNPLTRTLARLVPASVAGAAYTALIKRLSSVLNDEQL